MRASDSSLAMGAIALCFCHRERRHSLGAGGGNVRTVVREPVQTSRTSAADGTPIQGPFVDRKAQVPPQRHPAFDVEWLGGGRYRFFAGWQADRFQR